MVEEIKKKEQKVHILVNNSGASWGAPYDKCVSAVTSDKPSFNSTVFLNDKDGITSFP